MAYQLSRPKLTVIVRNLIFTSKCTKKHMAAGLRPDLLGELERSLRPLAAVAVVVEWIIASDSLVADRDVLQVQQRDWK